MLSLGVYADTTNKTHKELMIDNLNRMNALISNLKDERDAWKIRSKMIRHAEVMEDSITLMEDMITDKKSNEQCIKGEKNVPSGDEACYEFETYADIQQRMTVVLIQHFINSQNVILKNIGVLQK